MADTSSNTDLTTLLDKRMSYLRQRQELLAQNVANADTPGYKARDLAPMAFGNELNKVMQVGMTVTDAKHIVPPNMAGANGKPIDQESIETLPNGNSVDVEQQMMEVSKTAVDYQGVTSIYRSIGNMIKLALKGSTS